jgi:hypothetical protein
MQKSSSESEMEIEFESDDSDDINNGDAVLIFKGLFLCMVRMGRNGPSVWDAIVGHMKIAGLRKTTLCAPCAEKKSIKLLRHEKLLSRVRGPFAF